MLKLLQRHLCNISRTPPTPKKANLQKIQNIRSENIRKFSPVYSSSWREHIDRVYEQTLYGRRCHIAGLTMDSNQSCSYIESICYSVNPDLVILGNFNSTRFCTEGLFGAPRDKPKLIRYEHAVQPGGLFCKGLVSDVLAKVLEQHPDFCKDSRNEVVYRFDHKNKHIHSLNYFTICNRILNIDSSKLMFGLPSDYLVFEDLIINRSIQQLRQTFTRVIQKSLKNKSQSGQQQISYQYQPQLIRDQLRHYSLQQDLLTQRQITYTTSLLNHVVKSCQRVLLFVPNNQVHQISENVHKVTIHPKDVYRLGLSFQKYLEHFKNGDNTEMGQKLYRYIGFEEQDQNYKKWARREVMEKFVILGFLKNWGLEKDMLDGVRVFQKMVIRSLFENVSQEQIIALYWTIKKEYEEKVGQIVQHRISNINDFKPYQKDYYTLPQMINTQQQRNYDFPVQLTVQNKETQLLLQRDFNELLQQIQKMIKTELSEYDKKLIEDLKNGNHSRENIVLYQKLLVEAKIRLKKTNIKLPVYHYGMMSEIFKDQIKFSMLDGRKKRSSTGLLEELQELKKEGLVKEVTDQDEMQKLLESGQPRISVSLDANGNISFMNQFGNLGNNQEFQNALKKDKLLKQAYEMSEITESNKTYEIDDEQITAKDEKKKQKDGRLRRVKGISPKK